MWIPENTYINICKVAQEIYKNHYQEDRLNTISVGTAHRPMNCSYMLEIPEEYRAQGFSFYDNVVCDAIYTPLSYSEKSLLLPHMALSWKSLQKMSAQTILLCHF